MCKSIFKMAISYLFLYLSDMFDYIVATDACVVQIEKNRRERDVGRSPLCECVRPTLRARLHRFLREL